ncbi:MAG: tyrosine-type recombinase/integrase [Planctomycetes bacterium]|nr:tyrosine-type recombinase/integrase [Planctomycetota bacterium]
MGKIGRPRKRRVRTAHPGVKLKRLKSNGEWVARYMDPETGREKQQTFTAIDITTEPARRAWAIKKSNSIREYRAAVAAGVAVVTYTPIKDALKAYFDTASAEGLKASTLKAYHEGADPFGTWCRKNGVKHTEDLNGPKLEAFRKAFVGRKAYVPDTSEGAGQGAKVIGERRRSPLQVNKCLRAIRTILNQWRIQGTLPKLDSDGIKDALRFQKVTHDTPRFLRASDIKTLLEAAQRHDKATFNYVRKGEDRQNREHHYAPAFEFITAALLTGCRFSELAKLKWSEVNLDAGEIMLTSDRTKTGHGRRIALDVSPALAALLESMKLRRGGRRFVFGDDRGLDRNTADRERERLSAAFGAPKFTWHDLRRTCGTFLACAPGVYAGAGAFHAAKRLGHSVLVSERHYAGAVTDIPRDAQTLEAAMGIAKLLESSGVCRTPGTAMDRAANGQASAS